MDLGFSIVVVEEVIFDYGRGFIQAALHIRLPIGIQRRWLAIDAIQKANSGHPGLPMGAAPMAYVLWQKHLKHDPRAPKWALPT